MYGTEDDCMSIEKLMLILISWYNIVRLYHPYIKVRYIIKMGRTFPKPYSSHRNIKYEAKLCN